MEYKKQVFQDDDHHTWSFIEKLDQESIEETSTISNGSLSSSISSCSSFDTTDDASSSSLHSNESQSPIKRGLSKFYHGKSESFTSLARVMSIEDLPKKIKNPYNKMMKMKDSSKSYKSYILPQPIISKKVSPFLRQRSFARSTMNPSQQNNN